MPSSPATPSARAHRRGPTLRVDVSELLHAVGGEARSDAAEELAAIHEVLTRMLQAADDSELGDADRALLRRYLAAPGRRSDRASGIDLTAPARLRPRHRQTLDWLLTGASEKEIAAALGLSVHTVHQYIKAIYRSHKVRSRAQLMARLAAGRPQGHCEDRSAQVP